jgi:hypothetical protein
MIDGTDDRRIDLQRIAPNGPRISYGERLVAWLVWSPALINGVLLVLWGAMGLIVLMLSFGRQVFGGDLGWSTMMQMAGGLGYATLIAEAVIIGAIALTGMWILGAPSEDHRQIPRYRRLGTRGSHLLAAIVCAVMALTVTAH